MSMVRARRSVSLVVGLFVGTVVASASLGGCLSTADTATKAGGEPPPVVLTMGTNDPPGRTASNQIEEFARNVAELTDGAVVVEPQFVVGGENTPGWDQVVARRVMDGRLDLAVVPARAWDLLGVETLRALNTPFLISTDDHLVDVVADDALGADLLAGLQGTGATGLALLPEELRHLFVFTDPSVTLDGLRGAKVRSPRSGTTWALLKALGLRPSDAPIDDSFLAAESSYTLAGTFPSASAVLGNLTLYPKINSVVVNDETLDALTGGQRDALRTAAMATRTWALDGVVSDGADALTYCGNGGQVVEVDGSELDELLELAQPVIDDLREDTATADLMDRIAALAPGVEPTASATCDGSDLLDDLDGSGVTADGGDLPDGTYRVEFTDDYLASHGLNAEMTADNHGVWTIVLDDGHWTVEQVAPDIVDHLEGIYQVTGRRLTWMFDSELVVARLVWSVDDAGDLHFTWKEGPPDATFHFGLPWTRVE
jgi:TRAP-type C4-dicarboxylate transport system substrate-binding protein